MDTYNRSPASLVGDHLAATPGQKLSAKEIGLALDRGDAGVRHFAQLLVSAGAISAEPDPAHRRNSHTCRLLFFRTPQQAASWRPDTYAKYVSNMERRAPSASARTSSPAKRRPEGPLRFGVWADGALMIDGLARKQLTVPPADTASLAQSLAALPEGALQALCDGPLRPSFSLCIGERDYPLNAQQTADLIAYIEQLPARTIRAAGFQGALAGGALKPGTDHRIHRLTDEES